MTIEKPVHFAMREDGFHVYQGGVCIVIPPHLLVAALQEIASGFPRGVWPWDEPSEV